MNKGESCAVQVLLDWVLNLHMFEHQPGGDVPPDEEFLQAVGLLAERSHAALGAGTDRMLAVDLAAALAEFGVVAVPLAPLRKRPVVDVHLPGDVPAVGGL